MYRPYVTKPLPDFKSLNRVVAANAAPKNFVMLNADERQSPLISIISKPDFVCAPVPTFYVLPKVCRFNVEKITCRSQYSPQTFC